jgi:hypothetical protein
MGEDRDFDLDRRVVLDAPANGDGDLVIPYKTLIITGGISVRSIRVMPEFCWHVRVFFRLVIRGRGARLITGSSAATAEGVSSARV